MAKITMKRMTASPLFYVGLVLLVVLAVQYSDELSIPFLGAAVAPSGQDVRITSHTDLSGKVLSPGSTVDVTVTYKNFGSTVVDFSVEHRLVAASLYPEYFATISPITNAVSGQEDSVTTKKVSGLKAGESITVSFKAPVPTRQSKLDGKSNVDSSYYQIIGAYSNPGEGYISKNAFVVHAGVLVDSQNAGSTVLQACVTREDCNGWLIGNIECQANQCVQVAAPEEPVSSFDFTTFYNNNKVLVLSLIFIFGVLIVSIAFDIGDRRQ